MHTVIQGITHSGHKRANNEDALWWDAQRGLALVADGMGGHVAGERASALAVEHVSTRLLQRFAAQNGSLYRKDLRGALRAAHECILAAAVAAPACAGMGSTMVAVALRKAYIAVAHVGDSRLYRWRKGVLVPLTTDHSLVQERATEGICDPRTGRNVITRALGQDGTVRPETSRHKTEEGDVYVLCTDGLSSMLTDDEIAAVCAVAGDDEARLAQRLVAAALERGGDDNVSVVIVGVRNITPDDSVDDMPDENYPPDNTHEAIVAERRLQRNARRSRIWLWLPALCAVLVGGGAVVLTLRHVQQREARYVAATNAVAAVRAAFTQQRLDLEIRHGRRAACIQVVSEALRQADAAVARQDIRAALSHTEHARTNLTAALAADAL